MATTPPDLPPLPDDLSQVTPKPPPSPTPTPTPTPTGG